MSLPDDLDIDGGSRRNGQIDIGADEWDGADPSPIAPKVIRVKPDGDDTNDGSSWTLAKRTIQKALNAASDAGSGEVWVKGGSTYDGSITARPFVHLYGGFDEDDISLPDRDWGRIATVIRGSGDVVTIKGIRNQWTTIDGFTITGGARGIYLYYTSGTISHNIIRDNGPSNISGVGISCNYSTPTIANNFIVGNTASGSYSGGGLYLYNSNASVLNNTIAKNTASTAGGVYIYGSSPTVTNNIVASNSSGVYLSGTSAVPMYNDVWGNTGDTGSYWQPATTENGPPDTNGNIIKDPEFLDADAKDVHILWTSGCKDAGLDTVSLPDSFDIDKEARRNGTIDIGADETTECWRYVLTLTTEEIQVPTGTSVLVTARVWDAIDNAPEAGYQVNFSVDAGEILSISPNGQVNQPPTSGSGTTNAEGYVYAYVTRNTDGRVTVTADIAMCDSSVAKNVQIRFGNAEADLVFLVDVTGSTSGGATLRNGIIATVDYLEAQLQAQGRQLRVAGIKSGDTILETLQLTSDTAAFKQWLQNGTSTSGGDTNENSLEALKSASELVPGCYIALATDAGFHYWTDPSDANSSDCKNSAHCINTTLTAAQVVTLLTNADCKVYIDAKNDSADYRDALLYVNGAMEDTSYGTYTFPKLRAAITQ